MKKSKFAYLGPEGSFTHQASQAIFGLGASGLACDDLEQVFENVEQKRVPRGVVPVENVLEGTVRRTVDLLINSSAKIVSEHYQLIEHALLAKTTKLSSIKKIYSHTQGLAQTSAWRRTHLPRVMVEEVSSTARAALLASREKHSAAIGSHKLASRYHLSVIAQGIANSPVNITRFFVVGPNLQLRGSDNKFSIFVVLMDKVGALLELLKIFSDAGINLTKIESRPIPGRIFQYGFLIEAQGNLKQRKTLQALQKATRITTALTILGSFLDQSTNTDYLKQLVLAFQDAFRSNLELLEKHQLLDVGFFDGSQILDQLLVARLSLLPSTTVAKRKSNISFYQPGRERQIERRRLKKMELLGITAKVEWTQFVKETLALSRDLQRVMSASISAHRLRERDVLQYSLPMLRGYLDLLDDTGDQLLAQLPMSRQQQALDHVTSRIHYARQYLRSRLPRHDIR